MANFRPLKVRPGIGFPAFYDRGTYPYPPTRGLRKSPAESVAVSRPFTNGKPIHIHRPGAEERARPTEPVPVVYYRVSA